MAGPDPLTLHSHSEPSETLPKPFCQSQEKSHSGFSPLRLVSKPSSFSRFYSHLVQLFASSQKRVNCRRQIDVVSCDRTCVSVATRRAFASGGIGFSTDLG